MWQKVRFWVHVVSNRQTVVQQNSVNEWNVVVVVVVVVWLRHCDCCTCGVCGCCGQRQSLNAMQLRNFRASTDTFAVFYILHQCIISLPGQLCHRDPYCTLTECTESLTLLLLVSSASSKPGSFTGDPICPQRFLELKCILDHPRIRHGNAFCLQCTCLSAVLIML